MKNKTRKPNGCNKETAKTVNIDQPLAEDLQKRLDAALNAGESLRQEARKQHAENDDLRESLDGERQLIQSYREGELEAHKRAEYRGTVLALALERQRVRANDAIAEYDAACAEISRMTAKPAFALATTRKLLDRSDLPTSV